MNDLIVQFAVLWGELLTEERLDIFAGWAKELFEDGASNSVEFLEEKLCGLMQE